MSYQHEDFSGFQDLFYSGIIKGIVKKDDQRFVKFFPNYREFFSFIQSQFSNIFSVYWIFQFLMEILAEHGEKTPGL